VGLRAISGWQYIFYYLSTRAALAVVRFLQEARDADQQAEITEVQ
jgi:hypothetical protein